MPTLTELLQQLEAAVRTGNRAQALDLARQIEQRLVRDHHAQAAIERRVRALLAELNQPATDMRFKGLEPLMVERDSASPEIAGVVYPVWFGTNRKPNTEDNGFTGVRHDRVTLGRVEVLVPEAHRLG
jgi:hypothetical protein